MRVQALRQFDRRPARVIALAAVLYTLGGCVTSPQQQQYNRHLTTIVKPATPQQREVLARTFGNRINSTTRLAAHPQATENAGPLND